MSGRCITIFGKQEFTKALQVVILDAKGTVYLRMTCRMGRVRNRNVT